jgi:hypothetical protein
MLGLICHGGPLDGRTFASRSPRGFVIVRKGPTWEAWWYDTDGAIRHRAQHSAAHPITREEVRGLANGGAWDVIAYDPDRMAPW